MKKRLFIITPTLERAEQIVNQLLLERVNIKQIHGLSKDGENLGSIPEATQFQKTDLRHSLRTGLMIGAIMGIIVGVIAHNVLHLEWGGVMLVTLILGTVFGAWSSTMMGMMAPNKDIERFRPALEEGNILLIVDLEEKIANEIIYRLKEKFPRIGKRIKEKPLLSFP